MPRKKLTEKAVEKIKPPAQGKQLDYYDSHMPGLVLRVNYGGRKTWRALHYRKKLGANGKRIMVPTTHSLGQYPVLKLKEAREKAREFLADPEKALTKADSGSFQEIAEKFIKRWVDTGGKHGQKDIPLRSKAAIERTIKKYIYPFWQHRPFHEIKRLDVADLLDYVVDNHGARQADIVLAIVRKIMNWYATRDQDYSTPIVPGMGRAGSTKHRERKRKLEDDEIRALWKACADMGSFGASVKVLLLTAQRRAKVATMKWSDIVDGTWIIPAEPYEKGNGGTLRLPQAVLDIIAAQPRIAGNPYVFFGPRRNRPLNSFTKSKQKLDARLLAELPEMKPWVLHDLRRTARSLLSRAHVLRDHAERLLGHAIPGVEGNYDQHDYIAEKAAALRELSALVESIINPPEDTNVVWLPEASAAVH